jgi:anti-sigma B factor antagonist
MDLGVEATEHGAIGVLIVRGEVDVATAPRFRQALVELAEQGRDLVAVDLDEVDFIASTGLGVLVGGLKRARTGGGDLVLVCTRPRILRVLEMTRLDRAFAVYSSVADAAAAVK